MREEKTDLLISIVIDGISGYDYQATLIQENRSMAICTRSG